MRSWLPLDRVVQGGDAVAQQGVVGAGQLLDERVEAGRHAHVLGGKELLDGGGIGGIGGLQLGLIELQRAVVLSVMPTCASDWTDARAELPAQQDRQVGVEPQGGEVAGQGRTSRRCRRCRRSAALSSRCGTCCSCRPGTGRWRPRSVSEALTVTADRLARRLLALQVDARHHAANVFDGDGDDQVAPGASGSPNSSRASCPCTVSWSAKPAAEVSITSCADLAGPRLAAAPGGTTGPLASVNVAAVTPASRALILPTRSASVSAAADLTV